MCQSCYGEGEDIRGWEELGLKHADGVKEDDGDGDWGDETNEYSPDGIAYVTFHVELGVAGVFGHEPAGKHGNANPA